MHSGETSSDTLMPSNYSLDEDINLHYYLVKFHGEMRFGIKPDAKKTAHASFVGPMGGKNVLLPCTANKQKRQAVKNGMVDRCELSIEDQLV